MLLMPLHSTGSRNLFFEDNGFVYPPYSHTPRTILGPVSAAPQSGGIGRRALGLKGEVLGELGKCLARRCTPEAPVGSYSFLSSNLWSTSIQALTSNTLAGNTVP
jgi:hypothetical protein